MLRLHWNGRHYDVPAPRDDMLMNIHRTNQLFIMLRISRSILFPKSALFTNAVVYSYRPTMSFTHSLDLPSSTERDRAGHRTLVRTSHQPVSQPMLPAITPDKELCSNAVDGRQESSTRSQQFHHLQS